MDNILFIGPSHILRLQEKILKNEIPLMYNVSFYGYGGMPTWYEDLLVYFKSNHMRFDKIIFFVPDFRFGNGVFNLKDANIITNNSCEDFFSINAPVAIDSKCINEKNDRILYNNCIKVLRFLCNLIGERLSLIFWCLAGREIINRNEGNFLENGNYLHPTWNYKNVISQFDGHVIDIYDDLFDNFNKFVIDRAIHPSLSGFEYLLMTSIDYHERRYGFFERSLVLADLYFQIGNSQEAFYEYCNLISNVGYKDYLLDKVSSCAISSNIYLDFVKLMELRPHYINLPGFIQSRLGFSYFKIGNYKQSKEYLISSLSLNDKQPVTLLTLSKILLLENDFEAAYETANLSYLYHQSSEAKKQIEDILLIIKGNNTKLTRTASDVRLEKISPEICIGMEGNIFLLGGAHKIKDYVSGYKKIDKISFDNFLSNINQRKNICTDLSITYAHVIFPDKQSLLPSEFPYFQKYTLGECYLSQCAEFHDILIYPIKELVSKNNECGDINSVTIKGDSHLSDVGFLEVIKLVLENIDKNNYEKFLSHLFSNDLSSFNNLEWSGDLAMKYDTPPVINTIKYHHVYDVKPISNNVKYNDGLVNIWLNNNALSDKVLLIFGDSYFNLASRFLSLIYKRVYFCRSRFFHKEVVFDVKPDIVLTGNAERYLSHVFSDKDAELFTDYNKSILSDDEKYVAFLIENNIKMLD